MEEILAEKIYGYDDNNIESAVAQLLINNKMTIATAESCTGGVLAHRLTNVSGSSKYMLGGVVSYRNDVKIAKVGVKKETLIAHGAVSEQTVSEMARGIQKKFHSDIGIGITGIAGPTGGTYEKPVGLVFIGLAIKDKLIVKKFQFLKDYYGLINELEDSDLEIKLVSNLDIALMKLLAIMNRGTKKDFIDKVMSVYRKQTPGVCQISGEKFTERNTPDGVQGYQASILHPDVPGKTINISVCKKVYLEYYKAFYPDADLPKI